MSIIRSVAMGALMGLPGIWHLSIPRAATAQVEKVQTPSQARVNARLDSLERLALTSGESDERWRATLSISAFGRLWMLTQRDVTAPPAEVRYPGVVRRLAKIYQQSNDRTVRSLIIGDMIRQAERAEAATFLAEVAQEPPPAAVPSPPGVALVWDDSQFPQQFDAINTLMYLGREGQAMLRRLHSMGVVREPTARMRLDELARQSFKQQGR